MRTIFRFAYQAPTKTESIRSAEDEDGYETPNAPQHRAAKLHALRDADAGNFLLAALLREEDKFGLEINAPADEALKEARAVEARKRMKKGDILLLNTRPPLTNEPGHNLSPILRSHTWLEDFLLDSILSQYFEKCSRGEVALSKTLAMLLPERYVDRAKVKFQLRATAFYKKRTRYGKEYGQEIKSLRTAAYLIYRREIWEGGPDLLCTFGLSGPMNLVWTCLLCSKYSSKLEFCGRDRFLMAEITTVRIQDDPPSIFPKSPETLSFAHHWRVDFPLETSGWPPQRVEVSESVVHPKNDAQTRPQQTPSKQELPPSSIQLSKPARRSIKTHEQGTKPCKSPKSTNEKRQHTRKRPSKSKRRNENPAKLNARS